MWIALDEAFAEAHRFQKLLHALVCFPAPRKFEGFERLAQICPTVIRGFSEA